MLGQRVFKWATFMIIGLLVVGAFIFLTPLGNNAIADLVSNTRYEGYAKSVGIKIHKKSPPIPKVTSGTTEIPVVQSSYCWGKLGCADYAGGKAMVEAKSTTVVSPGSSIRVSFDYKPLPTQLIVQQYQNDEIIEIPLSDGYYVVPKERGVYYYGISAFWQSEDGKYSKGDISSVFVIEVI
ncbi:hypothetical protein [Paenibacillus eucommiae]|uniref:Uncharacterized protein n=1 Tax=Paenibacillus eucommiae TaxID=1355755 RepID=A0ABS4IZI6_9BACL|nr:hypothetical protein [Paenibacillus eucommiae]MBP1993005.1 hypothetical protein [Paenibacillus eucommiae]